MSRSAFVCLLLLAAVLASCGVDDAATDQPAPTPTALEFVFDGMGNRRIRTIQSETSDVLGGIVAYHGRLTFPEELCVSVNERKLWEPGDTAGMLQDHLQNSANYTITVDDETLIPGNGHVVWETGLSLNILFDEEKRQAGTYEPIGSYGDIAYCFETASVPVGRHTATVAITSVSGIPYSLSWQFDIFE